MEARTRDLAIEVLCRLDKNPRPVEHALDDLLADFPLRDPRDRPFLQALISGVFRRQGYLDWVISRFSRHPLKKMKPRTLAALRVGIFQLLFMDRVPASAAINETVGALKRSRQPKWLTGFVNGVLRAVARKTDTGKPSEKSLPPEKMPLEARLSHPRWLINRWKNRYGVETVEKICAANNISPTLCLRVNTSKTTRKTLQDLLKDSGIGSKEGGFSSKALLLGDYKGKIEELPGYTEGLFQVQGEAAQLATEFFLPMREGGLYLDGCAGLGGKTTHLAEELPPRARLTAVEPDLGRVARLRENLSRLQLESLVDIFCATLEDHDAPAESYNGILLDAPCSGLGVIRRHPEIRWHRQEADLLRYQEKQLSLLNRAADLLATDGVLVYITCSTEPEENENVIDIFCKAHPEMAMEDGAGFLPREIVDEKGFLRTLPDHHELDGFFGARLRKQKK